MKGSVRWALLGRNDVVEVVDCFLVFARNELGDEKVVVMVVVANRRRKRSFEVQVLMLL